MRAREIRGVQEIIIKRDRPGHKGSSRSTSERKHETLTKNINNTKKEKTTAGENIFS